jgi:hypothetical protein
MCLYFHTPTLYCSTSNCPIPQFHLLSFTSHWLGCFSFLGSHCWTIFLNLLYCNLSSFLRPKASLLSHSSQSNRTSRIYQLQSHIKYFHHLTSHNKTNRAATSMQNHQPLAPLSAEADRLGVRGRKMAPTGGNRSWSEEEVSTAINAIPHKILTLL